MVAALVLSASGMALAQSVGGAQISGVITDPTGAMRSTFLGDGVIKVHPQRVEIITSFYKHPVALHPSQDPLPGLASRPPVAFSRLKDSNGLVRFCRTETAHPGLLRTSGHAPRRAIEHETSRHECRLGRLERLLHETSTND